MVLSWFVCAQRRKVHNINGDSKPLDVLEFSSIHYRELEEMGQS